MGSHSHCYVNIASNHRNLLMESERGLLDHCKRHLDCQNSYNTKQSNRSKRLMILQPRALVLLVPIWHRLSSVWHHLELKANQPWIRWVQNLIRRIPCLHYELLDNFDHHSWILYFPALSLWMLQTERKLKEMSMDHKMHESLCWIHHFQHLLMMVPWVLPHSFHFLLLQPQNWSKRKKWLVNLQLHALLSVSDCYSPLYGLDSLLLQKEQKTCNTRSPCECS